MIHDFWDGRSVMVTGGSGFLGSHLVEELRTRSDDVDVFIPRSDEYDLRERAAIRQAFVKSGSTLLFISRQPLAASARTERIQDVTSTTMPLWVSNSWRWPGSSTSRNLPS